jgi:hypothetical protein
VSSSTYPAHRPFATESEAHQRRARPHKDKIKQSRPALIP